MSVYGSAGVLTRGRGIDYAIAGAGLGLAAATKYTAGIVVLPLAVACAAQLLDEPPRRAARHRARRRPGRRLLRPREPARAAVLRRVLGRRAQAGGGGVGIRQARPRLRLRAPLLPVGADLGPRAGCRLPRPSPARCGSSPRTCAGRCSWCPGRSCSWSTWGRRSGSSGAGCCRPSPRSPCSPDWRSCAPSMRSHARPRARVAVGATLVTALLAQGLFYSVHVDRVLSRDDTRNEARAWMVAHVPPQSKVVVEPIVPDAWFADPDVHDAATARARRLTRSGRRWVKFPTGRTTIDEQGRTIPGGKGRDVSIEDYERTLRPALVALVCARRLLLGDVGLDAVRSRVRRPRRGAERDRLLPHARPPRRRRAGDDALPRGRRPGRLQLRLELQPLPARLRATGADRGDPAPAGRDVRSPSARQRSGRPRSSGRLQGCCRAGG